MTVSDFKRRIRMRIPLMLAALGAATTAMVTAIWEIPE